MNRKILIGAGITCVALVGFLSLMMSGPSVPERLILDSSLISDGKFKVYRDDLPDIAEAKKMGGDAFQNAMLSTVGPLMCTANTLGFEHSSVLNRGNRKRDVSNLARPFTGYAQFKVEDDLIEFPDYGFKTDFLGSELYFETVEFEGRQVLVLVAHHNEVRQDDTVVEAFDCQYPVIEYTPPKEPSSEVKLVQQAMSCLSPLFALVTIGDKDPQMFNEIAREAKMTDLQFIENLTGLLGGMQWAGSALKKASEDPIAKAEVSKLTTYSAQRIMSLAKNSKDMLIKEVDLISRECKTPPNIWGE